MNLTEREIPRIYTTIKKLHTRYLQPEGIKLPRLENGKQYTKDALVLCLLYKYKGKAVSKTTLTQIIQKWFPNVNDVQQARHLARQKGFFILSGTRGDMIENIPEASGLKLKHNEYCLITLSKPYPGFSGITGHRSSRGGKSFSNLVRNYKYRCATCGSKQGGSNFLNPLVKTKLQKGHMNPNLPLAEKNTIPQCSECNRAYRDWFIFDGNGRVTDINIKAKRWQKKYKLI